jgi:RNA polymerase sigma factor (sigma-70 family)
MQKTNALRDELLKELTDQHMEKLFYFCLKKTGSHTEAEDLTQDIALQIVTALNKGIVPECFSAWVWKIAKNRYAAWAKEKHSKHEHIAGGSIDDYDMADQGAEILDTMVHTEQMTLLRRELAFIKREYRDILVAYYIEDESVRSIASSLSLTESAVQQRLHRARNILKEGMEMAREFGKLSYKPENIGYIFNGCRGENNEPLNYIFRGLCKNILLAAYRTPATAEELAMEVGVALPYMEEELNALVNATLMKKNGNKYETNFFIVSADAQEKIAKHLKQITPSLAKAVIDAMEFDIGWRNENCPAWHEGYQPAEIMKTALLMDEADTIDFSSRKQFNKDASEAEGIGPWGHTIRPHGGEWDLLGTENYHGERPDYVSLTGCVSGPLEKDLPEIIFRQFRFDYMGIESKLPPLLTYADGKGIESVANGIWNEVEESILKRLEEYGYIRKTEDGYLPTILVMRREKNLKMPPEVKAQLEKLRDKAREIALEHYLFCRNQILAEVPAFLKEDTFQIDHACANIFHIRGAIFEEALRMGYLSVDTEKVDPTLGAYLVL